MSAVDLAAVVVTVVCLLTVALLGFAVVALVRSLRELRAVVTELRETALPMVDDLRSTVNRADTELHRFDGVISKAERIAATVDLAGRLTYRAFAPPLVKSVSLLAGMGHATRRLRARRHTRKSLDVASSGTAGAASTRALKSSRERR